MAVDVGEYLNTASTTHAPKIKLSKCQNFYFLGSLNDFQNVPGLANLFGYYLLNCGSKRYPERDAFDLFLKLHDGNMWNANKTDFDQQKFVFQVSSEYLEPALER